MTGDEQVATAVRDSRVVRVGIGEFAVSDDPRDVLTAIALGSCVAVVLWEPVRKVGGLLHFMLPESRVNSDRARTQPAAFADTGITKLFHAAYELGAQKRLCNIRLVGGADVTGNGAGNGEGIFNVGRRNILAARSVLWRNGIMVAGEAVGGTTARSISVNILDGKLIVKTEGHVVAEL
jgi:chemotaxis protein CheD